VGTAAASQRGGAGLEESISCPTARREFTTGKFTTGKFLKLPAHLWLTPLCVAHENATLIMSFFLGVECHSTFHNFHCFLNQNQIF